MQRTTRFQRRAGLALAIAVLVGGCTSSSTKDTTVPLTDPAPTTSATSATSVTSVNSAAANGTAPRLFDVAVSKGTLDAVVETAEHLVTGTDLDATRTAELTAKLPAWDDPSTAVKAFEWPAQSPPPPRTGNVVTETFPPAGGSAETPSTATGPLKVLRVQPEGDVPIAPYLAVTFDQPMVAVGTVAQVDAAASPVKLSPEIPGRWRWIGTSTIRFDADSTKVDRLPMATTFTATVPAGTTSATGGTLATAATFTFTTPAPTVTSFAPSGSDAIALQPVFVVLFDQRVDHAAVLRTITLDARGTVPLRLATRAEIAADDTAKAMVDRAVDGRWVAFRPARPMPTDTSFTVSVGPRTPSAEGPRTTTTAQTYTGQTYGPLEVEDVGCSYGDECPPGSPLWVEFTNPLDPKAAGNAATGITVRPAITAQTVTVDGRVRIEGATKARTTYTITLPASLTDVYGQRLGKAKRVDVTIGREEPWLRQLDAITTLDPFAKDQKLSVVTVNHRALRVRVFEADPAALPTYLRYVQERDDERTVLPNWKQLADTKVTTSGAEDAAVETRIDLAKPLGGKPGQVIVVVEPVPAVRPGSDEYWANRPIVSWVQSTTMALDSFTDDSSVRAWATDLRTGVPIAGLEVSAWSRAGTRTAQGASGRTDDAGLARLAASPGTEVAYVIGRRGAEAFVLPVDATPTPRADSLVWYAFDDRQLYRPGETLHLKGWVRRVSGTTSALSIATARQADYVVHDAYGVEIGKGSVTLGALGGFDLALDIPKTANTGPASIAFTSSADPIQAGSHGFQIAEFRRPEFEVKVQPLTATPFLSTRPVTMTAQASYYAGGPLPGSPVAWTVTTSDTSFSPAGWDDFTFGIFRPWWFDWSPTSTASFLDNGSPAPKQYSGTTDASGRDALRLDFSSPTGTLPDLPVSVSVSGTVTDVNRQSWSDSQTILVHAADRYVGLRSDRPFVQQGDPLRIESIVTDVDGKAIAGTALTLTAGLVRTSYRDGKVVEELVDPQTCKVTTAAEASSCEFDTPAGGQYKVSSVVADARGGRNRTELTVWVSGAESLPARTVEQEALTLVPDRRSFAAGDTAKLLVQAPFATGTGMLVVTHVTGVRTTQKFAVEKGTAELTVPIAETDVPGLGLTVEVVGASDRVGLDGKKTAGAPKRPAYAVGSMTLPVPPQQRTLKVTATPADKELLPGGSTKIAVTVNDAGGAPVQGAELAVVVVDEAVLGLTDYVLPDPVSWFYGAPYTSLATAFGRRQVQLVDPETLLAAAGEAATAQSESAADATAGAAPTAKRAAAEPAMAPAAPLAATGGGAPAATVAVRSNFDALALFQPSVRTDATGRASVDVTLPDNLTRYRVMVVSVSGSDRFGTAESTITARLPLSVRPSAPRFLNTGDAFELPVVLQNISAETMSVDVVLQIANLDATGPLGRRVEVPANDRIEVRFPVKVRAAGTARVRVSGFAAAASDSAEVSIPVFTPATAEAFATYGTIDSGAVRQPLLTPTDVIDSVGGLEISTSSTSLQALTDALLYVNDYDYQSSDAYASRIMAISALRGVLKDFAAEGLPSDAALNAAVERDIAGLVALQNDDGGWSYWRRSQRSEPWNTVQAAHALVVAKQAGFTVSPGALDRALEIVANIESYIPAEYGERYRDVVRSYAVWVSALAGRRDPAKASSIFAERASELNLDSLAWLWSSLDDASAKATVERTITNRAVDTAGAISFTSGYTDRDYLTLGSDHRTDAIVLDALIANAPRSDMIPKVVTGLLAHRVKGRWDNMQENTFALLAFKRYYDTYEASTPDFVARAWLGTQFAGEHRFQGRSTDRSVISVPMKTLLEGGDRDLVLSKDGAGRLYYRIGLRYVPTDLTLDPLDRGFVVQRVYEGVDKASDVTRDADGTWHVKAGAKVRVRLSLVAESERTFVALVDPLPAGFEGLNPALSGTEPVSDPSGSGGSGGPTPIARKYWWWGPWYEFQQFRDDRSEAFSTYLPAGVYEYVYIARATTPGSFVVPPTRAEEMYAPETFGRAGTDRVIVG